VGELDIVGLQLNLAAVMGALSPTAVREAVYQAEAAIDSIRSTMERPAQRAVVERVLKQLEASLARQEGDPQQ
jgi:hypothetical protein